LACTQEDLHSYFHWHLIKIAKQKGDKMAEKRLDGLRVAILVTKAFEEIEMTSPRQALEEAGAETMLIAPMEGKVQAFDGMEKSKEYPVDLPLHQANPSDFDALLLPGGTYNADKLRMEPKAQSFVKQFDHNRKPIAVICHAPWLLISAGLVDGRTLTSYHTLQDDVRNAGGSWVDRELVEDGNWVSSRKPDDLPVFNEGMIKLFARIKEREKLENR
jgi:protease I